MTKRINITRVFKQRDKLFNAVSPYFSLYIADGTLIDLVDDLYKVLPPTTSADALYESCRAIAGVQFTRKFAAEFVWRLAGNIDLLSKGEPVIPWTRQIHDEKLPVQVTHVDPGYRHGTPGHFFRLRALAGSFCPGVFEQFFSRGSAKAISRVVGFSRAMPYSNPAYFVGLRFIGCVEANKSKEVPYFGPIDCSPAMKSYNKKIIAIRTRRKPCPRNYEHACEQCPVGADKCKAGIFLRGLIMRYCSTCNKMRQFDISRSEEMCYPCWAEARIRRHAGA